MGSFAFISNISMCTEKRNILCVCFFFFFFLSFSGHSRDQATYQCFLEEESRDKEIKKTRKQKIKVEKIV
jgi:hypothetical protein